MVPPARLELALPKEGDFKSPASTIPPRGRMVLQVGLEPTTVPL